MTKIEKSIIKTERFNNAYKAFLAKKTLKEYTRIIEQIDKNNLIISSKSKYLQVKAVLKKCNKIDLRMDYQLLDWNKREDRLKENVIDKLLTKEHFNNLLASFPKTDKGQELVFACKIAYHGGLRLSEVLSLTRKNFVIGSHVKITFKGKGSKSRIAYLPLNMKNLINAFNSFSINVNYIETTFRRSTNKVGLNCTFHSLRHSFASNLLHKNVKLNKIQQLLGHANISTTSIYLHCLDDVDENMVAMGY